MSDDDRRMLQTFSCLFQAHPWHGIDPGEACPEEVCCFIEIVPTDAVKYEVDKATGHLRLDRPHKFSSICPTMYGFIPRTYCGQKIAELAASHYGKNIAGGDADPLDICVLTERPIAHGNIIVTAKPIGGMLMIDHGEADDKIIAVLESDLSYGRFEDIRDCPLALVDRLKHYFLSYKKFPDAEGPVEIAEVYDKARAFEVINTSFADYQAKFGKPEEQLGKQLFGL